MISIQLGLESICLIIHPIGFFLSLPFQFTSPDNMPFPSFFFRFLLFFLFTLVLLLPISSSSPSSLRKLSHRRLKRDFMFAAGNSTDPMPTCFQACNREWAREFEREFGMNTTDFYDFPFHPKVLDYAQFLAYCRLADKQTQCFLERCGDQSADRVFSPSNFLCSFKRQHFLRVRACLEASEPISFLRCDQQCHPPKNGRRGGGSGRDEEEEERRKKMMMGMKKAEEGEEDKGGRRDDGREDEVEDEEREVRMLMMKGEEADDKGRRTRDDGREDEAEDEEREVRMLMMKGEEADDKGKKTRDDGRGDERKKDEQRTKDGREDEEDEKRKRMNIREEDEGGWTRAQMGKVFSGDELEGYKRELHALCTFQHCYSQCQEDITAQICSPGQAAMASELVRTYVQWHSADLLDWHVVTGNERWLPGSCARLAMASGKQPKGPDPVLRAMLAVA